jgi:hypothetical protein
MVGARRRWSWLGGAAADALSIPVMLWWWHAPRPVTVTEGKFPEELVYARSRDDVVSGGVMFTPRTNGREVRRRDLDPWLGNELLLADVHDARAGTGRARIHHDYRKHTHARPGQRARVSLR